MKKLFLLIIVVHLQGLYAQNDTIPIHSYTRKTDSINRALVFKHNDTLLDHKTVKQDKCYTVLKNGSITERQCYDATGKLLSKLYKDGEGYIMEEYGSGLKKTFFGSYIDTKGYEQYNADGSLKLTIAYKQYYEIAEEKYYKDGRLLFTFTYKNEVPDFVGDTLSAKGALNNGLYFMNDTLYAVQDKVVVSYKYFKDKKLRHYWSAKKRVVWNDAGRITATKSYKESQKLFNVTTDDYFEYLEFDENGSQTLEVSASANRIGSIEIRSPGRKIKLNYFLGQLQQGKQVDYFEGGCYMTLVSNNGPPRKIREIYNSDKTTTQDPVKDFTFFPDEFDQDEFLKTGYLITLQEYDDICRRALAL